MSMLTLVLHDALYTLYIQRELRTKKSLDKGKGKFDFPKVFKMNTSLFSHFIILIRHLIYYTPNLYDFSIIK